MQLSNILVTAILALGISAAPSIESRNSMTCYDGKVYNPQHRTCECPPEKYYDTYKKRCAYPPMHPPSCQPDEKKWCSKSRNEYCEYDTKNEKCEDDGWGATWCCKDKDVPQKMHDNYPDNKPMCKDKQKYNCNTRQCECPKGMHYEERDQKCHWPTMPKPQCPWPKKPWCGKGQNKYCGYDPSQWTCENDGSGDTFCASDFDLLGLLASLFG